MLIGFTLSYLEKIFVLFYLSFNFILALGASARDALEAGHPMSPSPDPCALIIQTL